MAGDDVQLQQLMAMPDEQLASHYTDHRYATIEALRRLKVTNVELRTTITTASADVRASITDLRDTLHEEERVIKRLTTWLVWLTVGLVVMTAVLVWLTVLLLRHGG